MTPLSVAAAEERRLTDLLWCSGSVFPAEELTALAAAAHTVTELDQLVRRRCAGERIEYLVGATDFCGVRVRLRPGVFVPRPRTALLVDLAQERLVSRAALLDYACGSGAIALALAARVPGLRVTAVDADPVAVACARENLRETRSAATVLEARSPQALTGPFDLITANLPYVPSAQLALLPSDVRAHEPRLALDGGPDGLDPLRRFAGPLASLLRPGGWLLTEVSRDQAATAERLLRTHGAVGTWHRDDATVVSAQRPA